MYQEVVRGMYIITIEPQELWLSIGNNTCLGVPNHALTCKLWLQCGIYFKTKYPFSTQNLNQGRRTIHINDIIMCTQLTMPGNHNSLSAGKLASLNRSWQSKECTYRALGMAGIEPTPSKSECDWTPLSPLTTPYQHSNMEHMAVSELASVILAVGICR